MKKLIELVAYKHKIDLKRGEAKYMDTDWLLNAIVDEVQEVKDEIRPNNVAHLEDELSDILWGWLTIVEKLKDIGYVTSHEAILQRALKKYEERILALNGDKRDNDIWKEVKATQKEELKKEKKSLSLKINHSSKSINYHTLFLNIG